MYKLYKGYKDTHLEQNVVTVQSGSGTVRELKHFPFHSPTGFEWGYQGSGPADLALAILVEHFNEHPPTTGYSDPSASRWQRGSQAWALHQKFKTDVVGRWQHDEWAYTSSNIAQWIGDQAK